MKGIELFKEHFKNYLDNYIIIGGAACEDLLQGQGLSYRSTKDIDMILIVEAINDEYISHFWEFIKKGKYANYQIGENEKKYYRFHKPKNENYPFMLELFSRVPDVVKIPEGMSYTPIPTEEDISSLSAILMNDEYYHLTINNAIKGESFHRASNLSLICLKAKAFLDLKKRKYEGKKINSDDIKKHKLDVFRISATLNSNDRIELTKNIEKDLKEFISIMKESPPNLKDVYKKMGITPIENEILINQLELCFNL